MSIICSAVLANDMHDVRDAIRVEFKNTTTINIAWIEELLPLKYQNFTEVKISHEIAGSGLNGKSINLDRSNGGAIITFEDVSKMYYLTVRFKNPSNSQEVTCVPAYIVLKDMNRGMYKQF